MARARSLRLIPAGAALCLACTEPEPEPEPEPEVCAAVSVEVVDEPGARTLELIAARDQIPGLVDQPTARGQVLVRLFAFDGRVHLGYGDYSANTGPIAMSAWDPTLDGFVDLGTLPSEEVLWFHAVDDSLYSPAIDPDGHQESGGVYRLDCGADAWTVETPIDGAVHVYDVSSQAGQIHAATGSLTGAPALVMTSDDRGASWTEILRSESHPDRYARFFYLGATPTLLFASGRDYGDAGASEAFAYLRAESGEFEILAGLPPPEHALVPITLDDAMVIAAFSGPPGRGTYLTSYRIEDLALVEDDGPWPTLADPATLVGWTTQPRIGDSPARLLVLMAHADGSASVLATTDLAAAAAGADAWSSLVELPALDGGDRFVSLAVLLDDLYLGTEAGSLYAVRELEVPARRG